MRPGLGSSTVRILGNTALNSAARACENPLFTTTTSHEISDVVALRPIEARVSSIVAGACQEQMMNEKNGRAGKDPGGGDDCVSVNLLSTQRSGAAALLPTGSEFKSARAKQRNDKPYAEVAYCFSHVSFCSRVLSRGFR